MWMIPKDWELLIIMQKEISTSRRTETNWARSNIKFGCVSTIGESFFSTSLPLDFISLTCCPGTIFRLDKKQKWSVANSNQSLFPSHFFEPQVDREPLFFYNSPTPPIMSPEALKLFLIFPRFLGGYEILDDICFFGDCTEEAAIQ